ncbi:hypothetical protein IAD21_05383 [Abditibacteriota bacterium]|nr:hypothetical protein IAD21_05383 [Abditibacteriota bacterium]
MRHGNGQMKAKELHEHCDMDRSTKELHEHCAMDRSTKELLKAAIEQTGH